VYLVDMDVISAGAPSKRRATAVADWMNRNSGRLFLSTITVAEIRDGIAKARRAGALRKASALTAWLDALLHLYGDRVLPFDVPAARFAGCYPIWLVAKDVVRDSPISQSPPSRPSTI
jgi:predicted nucleic acid-binding protein